MLRKLIIWAALVLAPLSAGADGNNFGAAQYVNQGIGGRAVGMGGAFVALADDATAGCWNPAGFGQLTLYDYLAGFQYAYLGPDINSNYLSYAFYVPDIGITSIAWINNSAMNIVGRDEQEELTGNFGSYENAFVFSYGSRCDIAKGFYLGGNLKILQQGIADAKAIGQGLDLGAIWQPILYLDHTLGVCVQNLFQRLYWQNGSQAMDPSLVNVKVGAAFRFFPDPANFAFYHLITAVDLDFSEYYRFAYHVGAEYWYTKSLGFRAGVNSKEITAGLSYAPAEYEVAYAFHYDLTDLYYHRHTFSLTLRLK